MRDLFSEASTLGVLLEETRGVVGVVLGTTGGEVRTAIGSFVEEDATAVAAATVTGELSAVGTLLGLGDLAVASLKAPSASRVFAQQSGAVLAIELDPKRPLGELENKLRTVTWAPADERRSGPMVNRVPTVPFHERAGSQTSPPPLPPPPSGPHDETDLSVPVAPPETPRSSTSPTRPAPFGAAAIAPLGNGSPTRPLAGSDARTQTQTRTSQRLRTPTPTPTAIGRITPAPALARSGVIPTAGLAAAPAPAAVSGPIPTTSAANASSASGAVRSPAPASVSSRTKSAGGGPVFTGDLEEFALPDLLEFLRNSHRSGLLMCTNIAGVGTVQLSRGMIIGASSPNALDLREHFMNSPAIGPDQRRALAELSAEHFTDELLDAGTVPREVVPADEMARARIARIYSAFREMIKWTAGRFSFDPGVAVATNPALALSAQSILMHIYQEQDEQGR